MLLLPPLAGNDKLLVDTLSVVACAVAVFDCDDFELFVLEVVPLPPVFGVVVVMPPVVSLPTPFTENRLSKSPTTCPKTLAQPAITKKINIQTLCFILSYFPFYHLSYFFVLGQSSIVRFVISKCSDKEIMVPIHIHTFFQCIALYGAVKVFALLVE